MVRADDDVTLVAREVVDAVGIGARNLGIGEVMPLDAWGFALSVFAMLGIVFLMLWLFRYKRWL